jgi:hypothetical protein
MSNVSTCWICSGKFAQPFKQVGNIVKIDCSTCGAYDITTSQLACLLPLPDSERYRFSFWNKQRELDGREPLKLDGYSIDAVIAGLPRHAAHEKSDILLLSLAKRHPIPGTYFKIDSVREYPLACARNMDEISYFTKAIIERRDLVSAPPGLLITATGWERVAKLSTRPFASTTAFVAMRFNGEMLALWRPAFAAAIERAKFEPRIANTT